MISAILVLVGFLAFVAAGYGLLSIFAGGMSDAPMAGREAESDGLRLLIGGAAVIIAVIAIGLWRWLGQ